MSDIPTEAVAAGVSVMYEDGWTCYGHEPDSDCDTCREIHEASVERILAEAAPIIAEKATERLRDQIEKLVARWRKRVARFESECADDGACQLAIGARSAADDLDALLGGAR